MERQFDVIVVGGGTAGFAAAVTAARGGAKTLLIEEKAYLGGTATGAQVSMFMGFADGEPDRPQQGIIKDVMDGLAAAGGTSGIETIYLCGRRDLDIPVIPYESEILKDLIFDLVDQAGVELLLPYPGHRRAGRGRRHHRTDHPQRAGGPNCERQSGH